MSNIKTRVYKEDDLPRIAHIHNEGWRAAYKGIVDQDYLDGLDDEERLEKWQNWLKAGEIENLYVAADEHDQAYGFISFGKLRTPPPGCSPIRPVYVSEIYAIYVLPDYWRKGAGRALMKCAAKMLQEQKKDSLCLWVIEKNKNAMSFYKELGGERCGKMNVEIAGKNTREICYGWRKISPILA